MFDMSGKKCGRLTVLSREPEKRWGQIVWKCQCDCGKQTSVSGRDLRKGHTQSCGCFRRERQAEANTRHGQAVGRVMTVEYRLWIAMRQRCKNPKNISYPNYGGRGIKVCERWESFDDFFADIGKRPGSGYSIERRDNSKGYEPTNCFWATRKQQARNKRNSRMLTIGVETLALPEWAERTGLKLATLRARLKRGSSPESAIRK